MTRGSDVAGNMRVFQTRFESSNLSFRSKTMSDKLQLVVASATKSLNNVIDKLKHVGHARARRQAAKALDCNSGIVSSSLTARSNFQVT